MGNQTRQQMYLTLNLSDVQRVIEVTAFPWSCLDELITKSCDNESKCIYISNAPYPLNLMIAPIVLVIILIIIAGGIAMIRFGKWSLNREKLYDKQ